ncbi:PD-(D/E)XK nuclease family protein [Lapillicoccus sp.]|uniref:RecB family exonuclease n=1 Tax=Lapillicoccus sp. TaxID=1909287 RepID=UPI003264D92C
MTTTVDSEQGVFAGLPTPLYRASPSRLSTWETCPRQYRMKYLDRPTPPTRRPRAHTSVGLATHNALRDWWDLPCGERTPRAGATLLRQAWIEVGFRDIEQSARWRTRVAGEVERYLGGVDPERQPLGVERTVSMKTAVLALSGRVDRLDERGGELVVVDYKTSRRAPNQDDARTSLPLAMYAASAWTMFRRRCVRVELHHIPTGTVAGHTHTGESLRRQLGYADSIAGDTRAADRDFALVGVESTWFAPRPSPLCMWCDYRAACPEGQRVGPEKSSWAALEIDEPGSDPAGLYEGDGDGQGRSRAALGVGARRGEPEGRSGQDDLGGQPGGGVR